MLSVHARRRIFAKEVIADAKPSEVGASYTLGLRLQNQVLRVSYAVKGGDTCF